MDTRTTIIATTIIDTTIIPTIIISTTIMIPHIITDVHLLLAAAAPGGRIHGVAAVMPSTNRSIAGPADI